MSRAREAARGKHGAPGSSGSAIQVSPTYPAALFGEPAAALPFPPNRADRPVRRGEVPSLYSDGLVCSRGCRPYGAERGWPLKPFHAQHPLRAALNELRPGSLHVGLDIQAPDGAAVYAVQPGYAHVLAVSGPNARIQVGNYIYWHINPTVAPGQYVKPFHTKLGTVMAGYGHLAFSELGAMGSYVNPLRPKGTVLAPYTDRGIPVIGAPSLASDGQIIVPAYSPQSFVERTKYVTPVLAVAGLAYRLFDRRGRPVTHLEWALRGTQLLPWTERSLIYTPEAHAPGYGCFAGQSVCVPDWTYRLAGGLAPPLPSGLTRGSYRLTIYAWNWVDHVTALDTTVTLTSRGWQPLGHFPRAILDLPDYYTRGVPAARIPIWRQGGGEYASSARAQSEGSATGSAPGSTPLR